MVTRRRILTVGVTSDEHRHATPFLDREHFEVDRFPGPDGALELLRDVPIDIVLVRYPLPAKDMGDFLRELRSNASMSRRGSVVILSESAHATDAQRFVGQGANKVVGLEVDPAEIQVTVAGLLQVAPRRETRFLARLETCLTEAGKPQLTASGNVVLGLVRNTSASGLLVETEYLSPVGTVLGFEVSLPNARRPIRGEAEVVRHARPDRERLVGMGMRILGFEGSDGDAYTAYLNGHGGV
jgi:CheY-like chemotaxis protein